jgi:transcription-repair coupling factor (superfamily II helicase)
MNIDAYIPEAYVPSEAQKITLYKRIASVKSLEEAEEMTAEVADRFGPPPKPVQRLLAIMRLRAQAAGLGITRIVAGASAVALEFDNPSFVPQRLRAHLAEHFGKQLSYAVKPPTLTFTPNAENADALLAATGNLLAAIGEEEDAA